LSVQYFFILLLPKFGYAVCSPENGYLSTSFIDAAVTSKGNGDGWVAGHDLADEGIKLFVNSDLIEEYARLSYKKLVKQLLYALIFIE
jgi:hypothetical protein